MHKANEEPDRVDVESGEVSDGGPLGLDEGRVSVEDDVWQAVSEQWTGSERSDEVHQTDLMRVAASTQNQDHVVREHAIASGLGVLHIERFNGSTTPNVVFQYRVCLFIVKTRAETAIYQK